MGGAGGDDRDPGRDAAPTIDWTRFRARAAALGLPARGGTPIGAAAPAPIDAPPPAGPSEAAAPKAAAEPPAAAPLAIALLGYDGTPTLWRAFAAAPEASDGAPHPMDRWSRRLGDALAAAFGGRAYFPFEGPPYHPFFAWAEAADQVWRSPIGMLVGAGRGLWVGYRAAIAAPRRFAGAPAPARSPAPCEACAGRPCETRCPVDAFGPDGYDVAACAAHLEAPEGAPCRDRGCLARRACPVAPPPPEAQAAFHLAAFRAARRAARSETQR